jgi:hypothetical protein
MDDVTRCSSWVGRAAAFIVVLPRYRSPVPITIPPFYYDLPLLLFRPFWYSWWMRIPLFRFYAVVVAMLGVAVVLRLAAVPT